MARFELGGAGTDPRLQTLFADILAHGFGGEAPINFLTSLTARPDLLDATWVLSKSLLVEGKLPGSVKQMIALSISRQNDCRYCCVLHRGVLESVGVDPTVVETCATDPETAGLPEPHRSIVQTALKAARDPSSITDEDVDRLLERGLSREEIVETLMMAAYTNFINAWADIAGIPNDAPE